MSNATRHDPKPQITFHEGYSEATRRAYASDWRGFAAWCSSINASALPAVAETVAAYVEALVDHRTPATIVRRMSAICAVHRDNDLADPTKGRAVAVALKRMYRKKGRRQK